MRHSTKEQRHLHYISHKGMAYFRTKEWRANNPEAHKQQGKRHHQKKKEYLDNYKVKSGCIDCRYNAHPAALHFDHVNGKKVGNISEMSLTRAIEEISKCVVRCANCHAVRHYASGESR